MTSAIAANASSARPALSVSEPSADSWSISLARRRAAAASLRARASRCAATIPVMRNAARTSQSSGSATTSVW
jgi:hypothetical protein